MKLDCGPAIVREWRRSDEASLLVHADNRKVWRNLTHTFPHPYTRADAGEWFSLLEQMAEPTHWAIEVDGAAVGGVGVKLGEGIRQKTAELGYWLGEALWGRGIATAVVRTIAPYAMDRFDLARLESPVFAWNPASMRVLEKNGFIREGVLRKSAFKDGQLIDTVVYATTRGS